MVDFRVTLTVPDDVDGVGYIADENGIVATVQDGPYLLSDGRSLVSPMPVFDAGGSSYLDSLGHRKASIPLNLSGVNPNPTEYVTHNGITVTHNGVPVTHGAA